MPKIANATFNGKNESYSFEVYSIDTLFNNVGAVYMFAKRVVGSDGKGRYTFLYIGQTDSLKDRIPKHEKWSCVKVSGVNCICVHCDADENSRIAKETDLRDGNDTPCNEQ